MILVVNLYFVLVYLCTVLVYCTCYVCHAWLSTFTLYYCVLKYCAVNWCVNYARSVMFSRTGTELISALQSFDLLTDRTGTECLAVNLDLFTGELYMLGLSYFMHV